MKKRLLKIRTAALIGVGALALGLLASGSAKANLIVNGSFESPTVPSGDSAVTPTSWTGGAFLFHGGAGIWPGPQDGLQYEDIGNNPGNGSLSQTFSILLTGNYNLSWYDNTANEAGFVSPYEVTIADGSGVIASSGILDAYHAGVWQQQVLNTVLSPGSYTVSFSPLGGSGGLNSLVDNVSLVPEPTTILAGALLLLPFGVSTLRKIRAA